ncbi:MAG TPA: hypothetical protein VI141_01620 [Acidimicrobiia bacterium]
MTAIALMSQTLRRDDCIAFLRQDARRWIVVVGDQHGIDADDLPNRSELVVMDSPLAGAGKRLRADIRRSAITWMRSGSQLGRMAETGLRKMRRLVSSSRRDGDSVDLVTTASGWLDSHTEEVVAFLESNNEHEAVAEIVVFDLFDLPAALAFGDRHGIPISVQ